MKLLNRRAWLQFAGWPLGLGAAPLQYRDYSRMLPAFLAAEARAAYVKRNAALARLTSPAAVRSRAEWVRKTFWDLAGGQPERTPLDLRTHGALVRGGYRLEKISYESQPGLRIPANLYIPTGPGPFPAVLFQMGHSLNGKASETYQKCCQGLARLGFLTLAFDPMGQGERTYYRGATGTLTRLGSADAEHTQPGKQMLLYGDTSTRMQTWDAVRSLDVLAGHPLCDAKRLATTGQSGGGTLAMFLAAVDERLAAVAVTCANTENFACAGFLAPGSTDDAEQNFLDSGPAGFDRWDTLYPLAPKPLLVALSAKDFFGTYSPNYIRSGLEEFGKLKRIYELMGKPEQIAWRDTPQPHSLSYELRMEVYGWFRRWLQGRTDTLTAEPAVAVESEEDLYVAPSGNVVASFASETPVSLLRKRAAAVQRTPVELGKLIGAARPAPGAKAAVVGTARSRGVAVEAIETPSAPGVWVPAWRYRPTGGARSGKVLVALEPGGRNLRWMEAGISILGLPDPNSIHQRLTPVPDLIRIPFPRAGQCLRMASFDHRTKTKTDNMPVSSSSFDTSP
ncbi:MAG: hypothetical protein FJW40_12850, partial [Acidobacteria bacterium]|nr:hypothetical protein [Acidobacteriota bacterium]